jgi:imidazolonepropionase-like amidohydrolase
MKQLLLLFAILSIASCSTSEKTKLDLLIDHANVVDVKTGQLMANQQIGVRNDTIIFVREAGNNSDYTAAETIDATGKFVIPGLWDMHVHFRGGNELIEENKNLLPLFIANGITGVREAGGDMTQEIFKWRTEIQSGQLIGPTIYTSGPKLDGPKATWAGSIPVTTKEEVIQAVDSLEDMGVDFIKIYDSTISREAYIWIIEEAKKRGITTSGHMPFTVMLADAVNAGLGSVEHLYYVLKGASTQEKEITQDVIDGKSGFWGSMDKLIKTYDEDQADQIFGLLKSNNTYVVPTQHIGNTLSYLDRDNHEADEYLQYIGPGIIDSYQGRIRGAMRANEKAIAERHELNSIFASLIPKMQTAGVSLLAGSDSGASNSYVYQGVSLHQELAALVAAGLSPAEALRTATINGAKFLKVDDYYGSIEVGKSSDLLILNANPLDDITNTQKINTLILGNRTFAKSDLEKMLNDLKK